MRPTDAERDARVQAARLLALAYQGRAVLDSAVRAVERSGVSRG